MNYENTEIFTHDYNVELKGEADISRAVQGLLSKFKVFFEQELMSLLGSRLALATEEMLNEKLSLTTDQATLLGNPIVENNLVAFVLDGSLENCSTEEE